MFFAFYLVISFMSIVSTLMILILCIATGEPIFTNKVFLFFLAIASFLIIVWFLFVKKKFKQHQEEFQMAAEVNRKREEIRQQIEREQEEIRQIFSESTYQQEAVEQQVQVSSKPRIMQVKCEYCNSSVFVRWGQNNNCPYCGAHLIIQ